MTLSYWTMTSQKGALSMNWEIGGYRGVWGGSDGLLKLRNLGYLQIFGIADMLVFERESRVRKHAAHSGAASQRSWNVRWQHYCEDTLVRGMSQTNCEPFAANYQAWRADAAAALSAAGFTQDAADFAECGKDFMVQCCTDNPGHAAAAIPLSCHLRYCPECERREQARKLARYIPAIWDTVNESPFNYTLKKFELTTPYSLSAADAPERFAAAWKSLERCLDMLWLRLIHRSRLSEDEIRRGRADMKKHGIGVMAAAEFGENGHKLHFHLIAWCPYIPKHTLTETWKDVTQNECQITWIKKINSSKVEDEITEQVKYVTKFSTLRPELVVALAKVLTGQRRFRSYGVFHGLKKTEEHKEPCVCAECGAPKKLLSPMIYVSFCLRKKRPPQDDILDRISARYATPLLDLKHGNNSGEPSARLEVSRAGPPD